MELTSSFGLTFFYDYATPSKVVLWLASIFSGIILCVLVYTSTAILSSLLFKGYGKLSSAEKIEWNNRGFSTFHALFVSSASFYLLILSDVFNVNSHGDVVINRSSTLSDAVLGISIGYFLTDLAMILWNFPALGGLEYVARIFLFMFLFYHIGTRYVEVKEIFLFGFYTLIMVPSVLAVLNIFWFWKIAKGMVKTLTKAKHSK
uniref:TLC domain-containing protein n=1 Tax=Glycine max TaxID=3847 RepID=A0A0R0L0Y6_SOYBN